MTMRAVLVLALAATGLGQGRLRAQDSIPWPRREPLQARVRARVDRLGIFRQDMNFDTTA